MTAPKSALRFFWTPSKGLKEIFHEKIISTLVGAPWNDGSYPMSLLRKGTSSITEPHRAKNDNEQLIEVRKMLSHSLDEEVWVSAQLYDAPWVGSLHWPELFYLRQQSLLR